MYKLLILSALSLNACALVPTKVSDVVKDVKLNAEGKVVIKVEPTYLSIYKMVKDIKEGLETKENPVVIEAASEVKE